MKENSENKTGDTGKPDCRTHSFCWSNFITFSLSFLPSGPAGSLRAEECANMQEGSASPGTAGDSRATGTRAHGTQCRADSPIFSCFSATKLLLILPSLQQEFNCGQKSSMLPQCLFGLIHQQLRRPPASRKAHWVPGRSTLLLCETHHSCFATQQGPLTREEWCPWPKSTPSKVLSHRAPKAAPSRFKEEGGGPPSKPALPSQVQSLKPLFQRETLLAPVCATSRFPG